jgi:uncharacterized membrane protein YedE/YeeE
VLSWLTVLLSDKFIGCSTPIARVAGMLERLFRGDKVLDRPYYRLFPPSVVWDLMFLIGILIGAFASSQASGTFALAWVTDLWASEFGYAALRRVMVAFAGGVLMGIGSRWAGGCTSGHGISGTMQLTVGSWLAAVCFFIGGIITAALIF